MSITDGTYYCARCGDDRVVCYLCNDLPPALVRRPRSNDYEAEHELDQQSRAIRLAAERRRGETP